MGCGRSRQRETLFEEEDSSAFPALTTTYEFNVMDDSTCRENFRAIEDWYRTD